MLHAGEIDPAAAEHCLVLCTEIIANDGNNAHGSEVARSQREVTGCATQRAVHFPKGCFNRIKCDGTYNEQGHGAPVQEMYLPMIGASRFLAAAEISLRSVTIACASAAPHLHLRSSGSDRTTSRIARWTFSVFLFKLAMISLRVTASCCGCQQS